MVRFTHWQSLNIQALADAPDLPGVVQICALKLQTYPGGRTTMLWYGAGPIRETLTRGLEAVRTLNEPTRWRFRPAEDPDADLERLLGRFERRFRTPPICQ